VLVAFQQERKGSSLTKKSKLQRRREMACVAYQGTMKEGADALYCGEIYLEDINEKLEERTLVLMRKEGGCGLPGRSSQR
jgi:hypothetical protein